MYLNVNFESNLWSANFSKKRTDEFVLFAFLHFTANKSNLSIHFLGESMARQSPFWFYLTFTKTLNDVS